jgi:hypothetical protein
LRLDYVRSFFPSPTSKKLAKYLVVAFERRKDLKEAVQSKVEKKSGEERVKKKKIVAGKMYSVRQLGRPRPRDGCFLDRQLLFFFVFHPLSIKWATFSKRESTNPNLLVNSTGFADQF